MGQRRDTKRAYDVPVNRLSDEQRRRALELVRRGTSKAAAARELGVSTKTIFRLLAAEADAAAAEDPAGRAERAALDALNATLPDGSPDHATRLAAARLLGGPAKRTQPATEGGIVHVTITRDEEAGTVTATLPDGRSCTTKSAELLRG